VTRAAIVETLAKDFHADAEIVRGVLEMLDAGLSATYVGHFRRGDSKLTESVVRRLQRRREELEELDRRRGTILRMLTGASAEDADAVDDGSYPEIRACMDRFELEDLFLPHRRPEPEVQLALDRGLGELADRIVAPSPKARPESDRAVADDDDDDDADDADDANDVGTADGKDQGIAGNAPEAGRAQAAADAAAASDAGTSASADEDAGAREAVGASAEGHEAGDAQGARDDQASADPQGSDAIRAGDAQGSGGEQHDADAAGSDDAQGSGEALSSDEPQGSEDAPPADGAGEPNANGGAPGGKRPRRRRSKSASAPAPLLAELPGLKESVEVTPGLARLCREFVSPDRGVHTEEEALAGALRILSDRLGRDSALRRAVRKALRKHAVLTVRASGDEGRMQRHKALLKMREPIRQLQSRKLLRLRQAQKDRAITTTLHLDPKHVLPRVKRALGTRIDPEFEPLVEHVAAQALVRRLLPMIEADVRLELKERADEEALRFLSQHLRQILLSPVAGRRSVAGVATNAKQDWILALLDEDGNPASGEVKIETKDKDETQIAEELGNALRDTGVRALAVASGKGSTAELSRLRRCVELLGADAAVFLVNEAGLAGYANSELARKELPDHSVPARTAISIGRRYQDLMLELLKVDPRNLGLGMESGLVSKANLRRSLQETVESAVALVGCDVNEASANLLRHIPGLDAQTAGKIVARRAEEPFRSRDELRESGILTEAQWVSAIAYLRVHGSPEPLDRTSLHPDQYADARRMIEAVGGDVEQMLGARGATKGLRRVDFGIDETSWRDLVRELSFPGRDPRLRLFPPALLPADVDPATLAKDQVVEGIVTNLTSFGAFVDLGIPREGLIHISEASNRYVRDAREVLAIGQVVRARVLDPTGQRITLSLKQVPAFEKRRPQRGGGGGGGRRRERDREREGSAQTWPELNRTVRAAQTRRDGLAGSGKGRGEGRGKSRGAGAGAGAGGGGPRRGGGGGGPGARRGRGYPKDEYDADAVRRAGSTAVKYNPFAAFFDERKGDGDESEPESGE
jgi:uncharacterized protein